MMRSAAVAVTALGGICLAAWLLRRREDRRFDALVAEYQRREAVLIRTISRLGGSPTGPMPRLHAVPEQASGQRRRP